MPHSFQRVYVESAGMFMPGEPVGNDQMDAYIAPLDRMSTRIKRRILAENGIRQRHYAIDAEGRTVFTNAQLAAGAIRDCLQRGDVDMARVGMLASGSSGGDALMPGFANMIQGELAAPPMETVSVHGICAAGVSAIQAAAQGIELGAHARALAVASEMPSRLFKRSRFAARGYEIDFDSHFLRWMLSDGAGALLLTDGALLPRRSGVRLRLKWTHQRAFSGDYPVCMQLGLTEDRQSGHLDFASWGEAEAAGALALRQDIRLLPHLFDIGIHEYAELVKEGWLDPARVNHFLCHYSSEKFIPVVEDLMGKANLSIPRERWWSNLAWRGNTGAASILVMLAEFMRTRTLEPGEQIFCYVPESGRFMAAYMLFEAEAADAAVSAPAARTVRQDSAAEADDQVIAPPHDPQAAPEGLGALLTELASIWHDYRSRVWRTPLVRQIRERRFETKDYLNWMENWIPQVREGSLWMREGAASLSGPYQSLAALIGVHAGEEQNDFKILFDDYRKAGGAVAELDQLKRNPGGEALNAYLHGLAATRDPFGLLGAIYIIEGTGQRIVPTLLPLIKAGLRPAPGRPKADGAPSGGSEDTHCRAWGSGVPPDAFRFLEYHGHNDENHLDRWLAAVEMVMALDTTGDAARQIVDTARHTATLYLMQFQYVTETR